MSKGRGQRLRHIDRRFVEIDEEKKDYPGSLGLPHIYIAVALRTYQWEGGERGPTVALAVYI